MEDVAKFHNNRVEVLKALKVVKTFLLGYNTHLKFFTSLDNWDSRLW